MSADASIADVLEGRARWCVVTGDCLEVLPTLPDKSVAHVITDPPYSRDLYLRFRSNSRARGVGKLGRGLAAPAYLALANQQIGAVDDVVDSVAPEFMRVAARWIVVFHDAESGHLWRAHFGAAHVRCGVWVKPNPVPQISGDRPGQGFESIEIAHRSGRKRWNGGGLPGVWTHNAIQGSFPERQGHDHPCPKPVELMFELVAQFTDQADLVLDCFAGSGTTGVACLRLGRRFIGIEKDPKYAQIARDRLTAEGLGQTLREFRAGQQTLFGETK